jgi:hypothetical protein
MSSYFEKIPDFDYVSRLPNAKLSDYVRVKNLFKRAKLREDIFQELAFFEKYTIKGDDRPDNVAFKVYDEPTYDWIILISNNIINIQSEWPLPQRDFDRFLLDKYGDYDTLYNGIHHYETQEVKNSNGVTIVPEGLEVQDGYTTSYYDFFLNQQIDTGNLSVPVTNYEYEESLNNQKRIIFILKPRYLNVVIDDMENIMEYKKGATQYVNDTLKRGDNIRLFY